MSEGFLFFQAAASQTHLGFVRGHETGGNRGCWCLAQRPLWASDNVQQKRGFLIGCKGKCKVTESLLPGSLFFSSE